MSTPPLLHSAASGIHPAAFILPAVPGTPRDGHLRLDTSTTPYQLQAYAGGAWHAVGIVAPAPGAGGAVSVVSDTVLGAPAASWTSPSLAGFSSVEVVARLRSDQASTVDHLGMQLNGDTAAHYDHQHNYAHLTTTTLIGATAQTKALCGLYIGNSATAGLWSTVRIVLLDCSDTTAHKSWVADGYAQDLASTTPYRTYASGRWASAAAISTVTLLPTGGNWLAGSHIRVYGYA